VAERIQNLKCKGCGKLFTHNRKKQFCTKRCSTESRKVEGKCKTCGCVFLAEPHRKQKYCSMKCIRKPQRPQKQCSGCSKWFRPKDSRYSTYCSRECASAHRKSEYKPKKSTVSLRRWARRLVRKHSRLLRPCEMCDQPTRKNSRAAKYCAACVHKMRRLYIDGVTEFRSLVCMVCLKPRDNEHLKINAGKRCKECQAELERLRDARNAQVRRAKKAGSDVYDTDIDIKTLMYLDNGECHICGSDVDMNAHPQGHNKYPSIDHVIPLALGGRHCWTNVALACRKCNSDKGIGIRS